MKFWDSSALVPLVLEEPSTDAMKAILDADRDLIVSFITPLEVESAIWRRTRQQHEQSARDAALRRLSTLTAKWTVLADVERTLSLARDMAMRHRLRAGDALQLGAALVAGTPEELIIVTSDDELRFAAQAEGFTVLP